MAMGSRILPIEVPVYVTAEQSRSYIVSNRGSLMFLTKLFDQYCTTLRDQIEDLYYRKRMLFLTKLGGKRKKPCTVVKELQLYTDKGFCPPKDTMIVVFLGGSVNEYRAHSLTFLSEITPICPVCEHICHFHGWYQRKVRDDEGVHVILVPRVKCVHCAKTHIILPDFLSPHKQYIQQVREDVVKGALEENMPAEKLPGVQAVSTSRRWIRKFRSMCSDLAGALTSIRMRLHPWTTRSLLNPIVPSLKGLFALCNGICEIFGNQIRYSTIFGFVNQILSSGNMQIWC